MIKTVRGKVRRFANQTFKRYPTVGLYGYRAIRLLRLENGTTQLLRWMRALRKRGFEPRYVLDVGANSGQWSQTVHSVFPQAHFVMIEPQAEMEPYLQHLATTKPDSYSYHLAGAAAAAGEEVLTLWDDLQGSTFAETVSDELLGKGKQRRVAMLTIDELIASGQMPVPDLIKLDVQGYELEALRGAERCFGTTEMFVIEATLYGGGRVPDFYDTVQFMRERNYVVYDFLDMKYRPFDNALGQADICFVKNEGRFRVHRWS